MIYFFRGHCYLWQLNQDFIWISFILFLNLTYLFHHKKIFDWDYKVFLLRQGKNIYKKDTYSVEDFFSFFQTQMWRIAAVKI